MDPFVLGRALTAERNAEQWRAYAKNLEQHLHITQANKAGMKAVKDAAIKELARVDSRGPLRRRAGSHDPPVPASVTPYCRQPTRTPGQARCGKDWPEHGVQQEDVAVRRPLPQAFAVQVCHRPKGRRDHRFTDDSVPRQNAAEPDDERKHRDIDRQHRAEEKQRDAHDHDEWPERFENPASTVQPASRI
ncbi:hypothetical protein DFQ30_010479 [Apophysomyces sp. BC1015]|nr:hypothetical protein DFQ30_010479 [Apophysomyces sp. BC1015]